MGVIQRQGIKNAISSYFGIVLGFISLIIIQPKFLKPEEIGLVRVMFAFSTLVASFIPLGAGNMTIKYFPHFKNPEKRHHGFFGFMLLFVIAGFIVSAAVLFVFKEFIIAQYRRQSPVFIEYYNYIFLFSLILALCAVTTSYLISIFKTTVPSYLNDIYLRVAYIALIIIYYFKYLTFQQFVQGYVAVYVVQLLLLAVYLVIEDKPSLRIDRNYFRGEPLKEMVTFSLLFSIASIAALGLKTVDSVLIGKFLPLGFVGIYAVASFIPSLIEAPLLALDRIVTPKVTHAIATNDLGDLEDIYYRSVKYLSLIGALLFVGINCNITYLLELIGKYYSGGVAVVWIISLGSLINVMGGPNTAIIFYSSRHWQGALLLLLLVLITFGANMLLIPRLGINGAAISTAISAVLYTAIRLFIVYRKFGFQPYNNDTLKTLLIMFICLGLNFVLPEPGTALVNLIFKSAVLASTFLLLVYMLKIVPEFHRYLPWEKR